MNHNIYIATDITRVDIDNAVLFHCAPTIFTKRIMTSHLLWCLFIAYKVVINPLTAKLFNWNFHSLEVVSRWRDPQLQVSENYTDLTKWRSTVFKYCWLMSHFIFNMFKRWYLMCYNKKMKTLIYATPAVKGLKLRICV